jgi:hypothetical protein
VVLWTERTGAPQGLASGTVSLGKTGHDLRIDAASQQITVTVDSAVVLTYTDAVSASLRSAAVTGGTARVAGFRLHALAVEGEDTRKVPGTFGQETFK